MVQESIQTELFVTLVQHYEQDPREFVRLPQQTVDSSSARIAVAEMRNEGYVEEQVRGVVRLTPRGYQVCTGVSRFPRPRKIAASAVSAPYSSKAVYRSTEAVRQPKSNSFRGL